MIVIVGFLPEDKLNGLYPSPQQLAQAVMDAFAGNVPGTWGLVYAPTPPVVNWWDGKTPPFKAFAREGCKVWKIGINDPVVVGIADTQVPWATEKAGYAMDVSLIIAAMNTPTWFIVAKDSTSKWVCLAGETQGTP